MPKVTGTCFILTMECAPEEIPAIQEHFQSVAAQADITLKVVSPGETGDVELHFSGKPEKVGMIVLGTLRRFRYLQNLPKPLREVGIPEAQALWLEGNGIHIVAELTAMTEEELCQLPGYQDGFLIAILAVLCTEQICLNGYDNELMAAALSTAFGAPVTSSQILSLIQDGDIDVVEHAKARQKALELIYSASEARQSVTRTHLPSRLPPNTVKH